MLKFRMFMELQSDYLKRLSELRDKIKILNINELEIKSEDLIDPYCDPDKPLIVDFSHISAAAYRLRGGIEYTPFTVI